MPKVLFWAGMCQEGKKSGLTRKEKAREIMRFLWHPLFPVTFLVNFYSLSLPNIPFPKDSVCPSLFFFPFRCISFGLLGSSFRAIPKHQKGGEKNRDYRREGQDKRTSCLAAFSDHGRKKRWSLCSTFLSPDASTFFYIHSLSLFSNQSHHLGGPWVKDIRIKWVDSVTGYMPRKVVSSLMFIFCPVHSYFYSSLHLIRPKPLSTVFFLS